MRTSAKKHACAFDALIRRLCLQAKEFFRNPFFSAIIAGSFLLIVFMGISSNGPISDNTAVSAASMINQIGGVLGMSTFLTLAAFLLFGFEVLNRHCTFSVEETTASIPNGMRSAVRMQLLFLSILALLLWAAVCTSCFLILAQSENAFRTLWKNTLLASILYGLLPSIAGIALGAAWQCCKKRIGFYAFLLILVFLASRMSQDFYIAVGGLAASLNLKLGVVLQKLLDFGYRLAPVYNNVVNSTYGQGIECFHWMLASFWILLGVSILLFRYGRRIGKLTGAFCLLLCGLCAVQVWHRGSNPMEYLVTPVERIAASDSLYYQNAEQVEVTPNFHIEAYEMRFDCTDELLASVTVRPNNISLANYDFTLYHGYSLTSVTDQNGVALPFSQSGDTVTVSNPNHHELREIMFTYSGKHPELFANSQGIFLPSYFCYYPVEGKYILFDTAENTLNTTYIPSLPERDFSVTVHAGCEVFTNLALGSDERWQGRGHSLTVVGGMYRKRTDGSCNVVNPWSEDPAPIIEQITGEIESLNQQWELSLPLPQYRYVFYAPSIELPLPNAATGTCISCSDTLLIGSSFGTVFKQNAVSACLSSLFPDVSDNSPMKQRLISLVSGILGGDETCMEAFQLTFGEVPPSEYIILDGISEDDNCKREVGYWIYRAMYDRNAKEVLQEIFAYLEQGGGDDLAFARSLGKDG